MGADLDRFCDWFKQIMNETKIITLAAGDGTRMKSDLPKVMHLLKLHPLIDYVVSASESAGFGKPLVVTSAKHNLVEEFLGSRADYVKQNNPRGTGHAVSVALESVRDSERIVVIYGDMPFVSSKTIVELANKQQSTDSALVLGTVTVPDFNDWRVALFDFGKIIRDENNRVIKITERKDANETEKNILEINPGYFCFKTSWLKDAIKKLTTNNVQKEYYLTDLVAIASQDNQIIETVSVDAHEAVGINTAESLKTAESLL